MAAPGSAPDVTRGDVRNLFSQFEQPVTPITAGEAAKELNCPRESVRESFEELADRGELRSRRLDDEREVWWQSVDHLVEDRRSEHEELSAFVSAVRDYAIFRLDTDGVVSSWNEGAERIKGYAAGEIVGEHFSAFYTEEDIEAGVPERNLRAAAEDGRVEDEGWRLRADGSRFWAHVTITAVRDDDGALRGFTKVTRDMTERREYEEELRRERDLTEQIFETAPVSICLLSADGEFLRANQRMLDRIDAEESELADYSFDSWEIYDADGEPISFDDWPWTRVFETGEPVHDFQCQIDLPGRGRRWLSVNAALIENAGAGERVVVAADDITDQKEREQRLRREHNQTRKLLRTAPIAIAVQDASGETVMANRRAQDALGLSEEEIIEHPDDADEWTVYDSTGEPLDPDETPTARVLSTGTPVFDEELVFEPPSGDRMHFSVNAAPVFGPEGEIDRVITAGEDVTELKKRERQLERRKTELETELSEIFDRISDAFYALDEEWRFTHLNDRAAEIMQHPRDELLGRKVWDAFPDADEVYRDRFEAAMETQEPETFEVYVDTLDVWLEFNAYPSETGLSIYFRDVTQRKEREQTLAKYETIVETVEDGIYVKDDEGRFTMVNEAYAELTGYDREELVGAHASMVVDETTISEARERKEAMMGGDGPDPTLEAMVRTADGDRVPAEATFATIETADGGTEQVGVVRDISDRREYERRLEASNERLEQFAYAASHDLQEPLRMVSSYLQLIEDRYADVLDEDGREFIEYAVDGADRMREMIDALLKYSRVETEGDPFEPVELEDVFDDVLDDLQLAIDESDAEITAEPLPRVHGDPGQLRQVFQNLVDNAIEYSGDEPPRVSVWADRRGDEWLISVRDEGIGIDPEDQERIFDVFQRLHTRDDHPGIGIGLALCQRIVERHGGEIWVESEPGAGSTFRFTLTAERADEE